MSTNETLPNPSRQNALITPADVLKNLRQRDPDLSAGLDLVMSCNGLSSQVTHSLAAYLHDVVPGDCNRSLSLLHRCLRSGVARWKDTDASDRSFFAGCLSDIAHLNDWQIFVWKNGRRHQWEFCSGPIYQWLLGVGQVPRVIPMRPCVLGAADQRSVRAIVTSLLVRDREQLHYLLGSSILETVSV